MSWNYDSGGKTKYRNIGKYKDSFKTIFKDEWPCPECGGSRASGHKADCPNHWRNKSK